MNAVARLDPKAYRRTPWKNGGGVTIDIADDYAPGTPPGSWSGMLWRFGRTQIVTPAPFDCLARGVIYLGCDGSVTRELK